MDNFDAANSAYYEILANKYDIMMMYFNNDDLLVNDERTKKFIEFRKTCNIPITSFADKVAFMIQFNKMIEKMEESQKKEKSIELAKKRYDSKSPLWKFLHKKLNPEIIDFENMSTWQIDHLYVEEENSKKV